MRIRAFAVVGLALLSVGCGSDKPAASTTPPTTAATTTSSTTTPATTPGQFDSKLLAVSDIWSGWELGSPINSMDLSSFAQTPCAEVSIDPVVAKRLTAVTAIQFQPSDGSYKHLIEFVVTGDSKQLNDDLRALVTAIESCAKVTPTSGGSAVTINKLSIPDLGDQRAAFVGALRESPDSQTIWYGHTGMVRMGSVVISLGLTEILKTPQDKPTISDDQFIALLKTAAAKFG